MLNKSKIKLNFLWNYYQIDLFSYYYLLSAAHYQFGPIHITYIIIRYI